MWDSLNTVCMEACDQVLSVSSCTALDHMCRWDSDAMACDKVCRYRWNYTKIPECNADPECVWGGQGGCKRRCTRITSGPTCMADSDCEWDEKSTSCLSRCSLNSPAECQTNPMCELTSANVCYKKCAYQYNQRTTCNANPNCLWNPATQTCATACSALSALSKYSTAAALGPVCSASPLCLWNPTATPMAATCKSICEYRHVTQAGCDADSDCNWDRFNFRCARSCTRLNATACSSASMCVFNTLSGECQLQCQFKHATKATCDVDTSCKWSDSAMRCQPSCARHNGNAVACSSDRECRYITAGATCDLRCSVKYTDMSSCSGDAGCMWDSSDATCKKTCALIGTAGECGAYTMCVYRSNNMCDKRCEFKHTTDAACGADNQCLWDPTTASCGGSCAFRPDSGTCNAQTNCRWDASSENCKTRCRLRGNGTACSQNPSCVVAAVSDEDMTQECKEVCNLRYTSPESCNADAQCMYSIEMNQCVDSCATLSPAQCGVSPMCEAKSATECQPICRYRYGTRAGCDGDLACKWDDVRGVCDAMCMDITSETACGSNTMCQWNGTCIWRCEYRHKSQAACGADSTCTWNQWTSTCNLNCASVMDASTCDLSSACEWKTASQKCVNSCGLLFGNDLEACRSTSLCQVNPVQDTCIKSCPRIFTAAECMSNADVCRWSPSSSSCVTRCSMGDTRLACTNTAGCMWIDGSLPAAGTTSFCKRDCGSVDTQLECRASTDCDWINNKCAMKCSLYDQDMCQSNADRCRYNFVWTPTNPAGCVKRCSLQYLDASSCNGDQACMWVSAFGECREACDQYKLAQFPQMVQSQVRDLCFADTQCRFDRRDTNCKRRCEFAHTTEGSCSADADCMWDVVNYRCASHCDLLSGITECASNPMCNFDRAANGGNGTCEMQCQFKYLTQSTCAASGGKCAWSTNDNACMSDCAPLNEGQCSDNSLCEWWSNECKRRCDVAYADPTTCNTDSRCMWDSTQSLCKKGCTYLTVDTDCNAVGGMCEWVSTRRVCQKRCESIASTESACMTNSADVTSRCSWNADQQACKRRCNMTLTQGACLADDKCHWDSLNRVCSTQCAKAYLSDCASLQRCVVRQWNATWSQCLIAPELRDATRTACISDSTGDTMWDPSALLCRSDCRFVALSDCATNSMCRVTMEGASQVCTRKCFYKFADSFTCNAAPECTWDTQRSMCTETCDAVVSPIECGSLATCQWREGACSKRCSLTYARGSANCTADAYCQINGLTQACENTCSKHVNASDASMTQAACSADSFCRVGVNNTCTSGCQLKGLFACQEDAECIWDSGVDACFPTCSRLPSAAACAALSRVCRYDSSARACKIQCRLRHSTQAGCATSSDCLWDSQGGFCKPSCAKYGSPATCLGTPECEWVNFRCRLQCDRRLTSACMPAGESRCAVFQPGFNGATAPASTYCDLSCAAKYGNQPSCIQDAGCMWSATESQCKRSCSRIAFDAGSGNAARATACSTAPGCTWLNESSICIPTCEEAYGEPASCDANANCLWDNYRSKCTQKCSLLKAESSCSAAGLCEWKSADRVCQLQCPYRYLTSAACGTDSSCLWNVTSGTCMPACAGGDAATCEETSSCAFNGATCMQTCEARCFTKECCQLASDCRYDAISGQCKQSCESRSEQACAAVPGICAYNEITKTCTPRCDVKYEQDTVECAKDANCMYDYQEDVCTTTCTQIAGEVDCQRQMLCSWDATTNKCRKTCQQNKDSATCTSDPTCEWLSARVPSCNKKCIVQHSTPDACKADAYCMWDPTAAQCVPECQYLVPEACQANFLCGYEAPNTCKQLCKYRHQANATCEADNECTWDSIHEKCAGICTTLSASEPLCLTSAVCQWTTGRCERQCIYKFKNETACEAPSGGGEQSCKWDVFRKQCINSCANYERKTTINAAEAACNADPFCEYDNSMLKCKTRCAQMTYTDCTMDDNAERCMWDTEAGSCKTRCGQISLQAVCEVEGMCQWTGAGCTMQCNFRYSTAPTCRNSTECSWDTSLGVCVSSCVNTIDPVACASRPQCRYDSKEGKCTESCSVKDKAACAADPTCGYDAVSGACTEVCTAQYDNQAQCNSDARCMWESSLNVCKRACTDFKAGNVVPNTTTQAQQECVNQDMCEWTNAGCTKRCDYEFKDAASCTAASACQWDDVRRMCGRKCSMFTTRDGCVFAPQCRWDMQTGTCKDRCSLNKPDEATCAQSEICKWTAGACTHNCAFHTNATSCIYDELCLWTGTACQESCEVAHTTKAACDGVSSCVWDPSNIICRRDCQTYRQTTCMQLPTICAFNATSADCFTRCFIRHSQASTCDADNKCFWDATSNSCDDACSLTTSSSTCNARDKCEWNSQMARCRRTCPTYAGQGDCEANPVCEFRGSKCQKKCEFRYAVPQSCTADKECMWNVNLQTCEPSCLTVSTKAECDTIAACTYNGTFCNKNCKARFSDQGSCDASTACTWDVNRLQCTEHCNMLNGPLACNAEPRCMYVVASTTCMQRCEYAHTIAKDANAATNCNNDAARGCMWNANAFRCEQRCDQYNEQTCTASSTCELVRDVTGSLRIGGNSYSCNKTCESSFADFWTCNEKSMGRCSWDRVSQACRRKCTSIGGFGECQEAQNCVWDEVARGCTVRCAYAPDCAARSDCVTDRNTGVCKQTCASRISLTTCQADQDCYWDSKNTQCRQRCEALTDSKACMVSPSCTWDINTLSCVKHCSLTYQVPGTCNADSRCMWDTDKFRCETACSSVYVDREDSFTQSFCTSLSMCQIDTVSGFCETRCQFRTTAPDACTTFDDCMWNPVASVCDAKCSSITDMILCRAAPLCSPDVATGTICVPNCPIRHSTPRTCDFDPSKQCIWNGQTSRCENHCAWHTDAQACTADVMCNASAFSAGSNGPCLPTCRTNGKTNKYTCEEAGKCQWDGLNQICVEPCTDSPSQIECSARKDTCEWNAEYKTCHTKCALKYTESTACNGDPYCTWDASRGNCTQSCASQPDEGACEANVLCQWRTLTSSCSKSCETYVAGSTCVEDANCMWNGVSNKCSTKCAYRYFSNVQACVADTECMWDSAAGVCAKDCSLYLTEGVCTAEMLACEWSDSKCAQRCASKYATENTCNTEATRCQWSAGINRCNTICAKVQSGNEGACVSNPQCMYQDTTCQDKCSTHMTSGDCTAPGCLWDGGKCAYDCTSANCATTSTCRTGAAGACEPGCSAAYTTKETCGGDSKCQWDAQLGVCKAACGLLNSALCAYDQLCTDFNGTCGVSCQLRHKSESDCEIDTQCMWNPRGFCDTACDVHVGASECVTSSMCTFIDQLGVCRRQCAFTPRATCALSEQCWIDDGVCSNKCFLRWGANGPCNADADCEWSATTASCGPRRCTSTSSFVCNQDSDFCNWNATLNRCVRKPCMWTDSMSCQADGACEWELKNQTCHTKLCPYGSTNRVLCEASPFCQISETTNVCVRKCDAFYTGSQCEAGNRCEWTFDGVCTITCSAKYGKSTSLCATDDNCNVDSNGDCVRGCSKVTNESICVGASYRGTCAWSDESCVAQCTVRYGWAKDTPNTECQEDPLCEEYATPTSSGMQYACGERCSQYGNETTCSSSSSNCRWIGSTSAGSCTVLCSKKYRDSMGCDADPGCFWYEATNVCEDRCEPSGITIPALCDARSNCAWNTVSDSCVTRCARLYSDEPSCWADANCGWNSESNVCTEGCERLSSVECNGPQYNYCMLVGVAPTKRCVQSCDTKYDSEATCDSDDNCQWSLIADQCQEALCREPNPALCGSDSRCVWADNKCHQKCEQADMAVESVCVSNPQCRFVNASCIEECHFRDAASCAAVAPWGETICMQYPQHSMCSRDCLKLATDYDCVSSPACQWIDGTCTPKCGVNVKASGAAGVDCQNTLCTVSTGSTCKLTACDKPLDTCTNAAMTNAGTPQPCSVINSTCMPNKCYGLESAAACGMYPTECVFLDETCIVRPCPVSLDETSCNRLDACAFSAASGTCEVRPCYRTTKDTCQAKGCQWNAQVSNVHAACQPIPKDCVYTEWTAPSACSVKCGSGVQFRTRQIAKQALPGGKACVLSNLTMSMPCHNDCPCSQNDALSCIRNPTCTFDGSCMDKPAPACSQYTTQAACVPSTGAGLGCLWIGERCIPGTTQSCSHATEDKCTSTSHCEWVASPQDGSLSYEPGNAAIAVFPGAVIVTDAATLTGINVIVDTGYSRGVDFLYVEGTPLPGVQLQVTFVPELGKLIVEGAASPAQYSTVLRAVRFMSTTTSRAGKSVTWALGSGSHFSTSTGRVYMYIRDAQTWDGAAAVCQDFSYGGVKATLATVTSRAENDFLSQHVGVQGWIGGKKVNDVWTWTEGSEGSMNAGAGVAFFEGTSIALPGVFANWDRSGVIVQPVAAAGANYVQINLDGSWKAVQDVAGTGFVCEVEQPPVGSFGKATIEWTGCAPKSASACPLLTDAECRNNDNCHYDSSASPQCQASCESLTVDACVAGVSGLACHIDNTVLPPRCSLDQCTGKSAADCASSAECHVVGGNCTYKTGCAIASTEGTCKNQTGCEWDGTTCGRKSCSTYNNGSTCGETCQANCFQDAYCDFVATVGICADKRCIVQTEDGSCANVDPKCQNIQPTGTAYTRRGPAVKIFAQGPTSTRGFAGARIAIVGGYEQGADSIVLPTTAGIEVDDFDAELGMLTIRATGVSAPSWDSVIRNVSFATTSQSSHTRNVSFAMFAGSSLAPVYEPTSARLIEFIPSAGSVYASAAFTCITRGGTLASIKSAREQALASTLAKGRSAWLGALGTVGSGLVSEWSWKSFDASNVFFAGSASFSSPSVTGFTFWAERQPAATATDVSLALRMDSEGTWESASLSDTTNQGFFCIYDASGPAFTGALGAASVEPKGCYPTVCGFENEALCTSSGKCAWNAQTGTCSESTCLAHTTEAACATDANCFYDAFAETCLVAPADQCNGLAADACAATDGCEMKDGTCTPTLCARFPDRKSCDASKNCNFVDGVCRPRLCGHSSVDACIADNNCEVAAGGKCIAKPCLNLTSSAECSAAPNCQWNPDVVPPCSNNLCSFTNEDDCWGVQTCLWQDGECKLNPCTFLNENTCTAGSNMDICEWSTEQSECRRKKCVASSQAACESESLCVWVTKLDVNPDGSIETTRVCRIESLSEQQERRGAAEDGECLATREVTKSVTTLAVLMTLLTLALAGAFGWIYWRQRNLTANGAGGNKSYGFGESGGLGDKLVDNNAEEMDDARPAVPARDDGDDLGNL
jgi:hypothetical protein